MSTKPQQGRLYDPDGILQGTFRVAYCEDYCQHNPLWSWQPAPPHITHVLAGMPPPETGIPRPLELRALIQPVNCTRCGARLSVAFHPSHAIPRPEDLGVCFHCNAVNTFRPDNQLTEAAAEQVAECLEEVNRIQMMLRAHRGDPSD